ncbi:MAG TPA: DNA N-6-adenine-methyltransferase [Xanthobacteraceae bacterium]|nr:DNA N-6-adenine-methyltransferase [Xanthobacteraceae bacterium]
MTLGSHQRSVGASQAHLTPEWLVRALGSFDLDPCAADPRPWDCAMVNYTEADDGLSREWRGRIWLNPPFHRYEVGAWIQRLADHGCGVALLHARLETKWFLPVWRKASAILFLKRRLIFLRPDGSECRTSNGERANSGAPVCLISFGADDAERLREFGKVHGGALIERRELFTGGNT